MRILTALLLALFLSLSFVPLSFAQDEAPVIAEIDPCPQNTEGGANFNVLCYLTPDRAVPFVITAILVIAVVISLFFLIWGGIKWITSGGDKGAVDAARKTIIAAIIGLIVVFLAWFIINVVLRFFTGSDITNSLRIPQLQAACVEGSGSTPCRGTNPAFYCEPENPDLPPSPRDSINDLC